MPIRILVTGANGFIGHHLCRKLSDLRYDIIALTHSELSGETRWYEQNKNFTVVHGDIENPQFTFQLFRQYPVDIVFHLAITPSHLDHNHKGSLSETSAYRINFQGTLNLLQHAVESGAFAWIQSSTMSVYNFEAPDYTPIDEQHPVNPQDIYGFSKLLAEESCHFYSNHGLSTIILRYSGVYGIGRTNGLIAKLTKECINNSGQFFRAAVNRTSDFIYVGDVVDANILAMQKLLMKKNKNSENYLPEINFRIYNIGSGEESSAYETAKLIRTLGGCPGLKIKKVQGSPRRFFFDISLARRELGFSPSTLTAGLKEYIDQIKKINAKIYKEKSASHY
jgi:UDP-glucose 4-epimerase